MLMDKSLQVNFAILGKNTHDTFVVVLVCSTYFVTLLCCKPMMLLCFCYVENNDWQG